MGKLRLGVPKANKELKATAEWPSQTQVPLSAAGDGSKPLSLTKGQAQWPARRDVWCRKTFYYESDREILCTGPANRLTQLAEHGTSSPGRPPLRPRARRRPGPNRSRRAGPAPSERPAPVAPHPVLGPGSGREWEWTPPWSTPKVAGGGWAHKWMGSHRARGPGPAGAPGRGGHVGSPVPGRTEAAELGGGVSQNLPEARVRLVSQPHSARPGAPHGPCRCWRPADSASVAGSRTPCRTRPGPLLCLPASAPGPSPVLVPSASSPEPPRPPRFLSTWQVPRP